MPLPRYIRRQKEHDERDDLDRQRYQTVFARSPGAVAAPTAALHFSDAVFRELDARRIGRAFVTLNVGMGTFKPGHRRPAGGPRHARGVLFDQPGGGRRR